jgi:hypothetical protein
MKNFLLVIASLIAFHFTAFSQVETEFSWPMELESEKGIITTLYQPQLESFKSNKLSGRMAITVKPLKTDMVFGAVWFSATMETDLENRTVRLKSVDIQNTNFPDMVDEEQIKKFSDLLISEVESWDIVMSLDRLTASMEEVDELKGLSDQIKNDPPTIFFRDKPAILVMIDGEPILKENTEAGLEYVVNTPFFLVKDKKGTYYINGGKFWYTSKTATEGFVETTKIPSNVKEFAEKNQTETETDSVAEAYTTAPEIIVQTKPAELIIVDGEMDYKAIDSTQLLYVSNTESDIIMDISSQNHYVLLAGRWYASKSLKDGDWKFVEPDALPTEFAKIPLSSDMSEVLTSIPGTEQAQSALLEQSIPTTATVDRKDVKFELKYDGEPKFEEVTGTSLKYAVNCDKTVLLSNAKYYAVENGIWYVSTTAKGPWEVSIERPESVDEIPPESPVYNVKYVYVYDSTPDVVYVGYLPGYTHSYVYNGVVVYGTGYYYHPWYGAYYYPRPVTYGYGVHYNPYTGWGFTVGISYGWVSWGYHPYYRHSYWGPRGYHSGYRHGYHNGYRHGYNNGYRAGYAAGNRNSQRNNVYANQRGVKNTGNIQRGNGSRNVNSKARPSTRPNNMYSDKKGNVYQRDKSGNYQNKTNGGASTRPTKDQFQGTKKPSQTPSKGNAQNKAQQRPQQSQQRQQLDRSARARTQGNQNYQRQQQQRQQQSRPQSRPSGGGAGRGGGGAGRRR